VSVLFIIGLISALFPSADGALTALTSSFCIDILGLKHRNDLNEAQRKSLRLRVHLSMTLLFFVCVMVFKWIDDKSIIDVILKVAGYTYGPLLGLFAFGIFTKRIVNDKAIPYLCGLAPVLTLGIDMLNNADWFIKKLSIASPLAESWQALSTQLFQGYKIGIELLLINGILTLLLLRLFSKPKL
jgi:hypothetical protein